MSKYIWSAHYIDRNGSGCGVSCSDIHSMLDSALKYGAIAITFHRGQKVPARLPSIEDVRGIFNHPRKPRKLR